MADDTPPIRQQPAPQRKRFPRLKYVMILAGVIGVLLAGAIIFFFTHTPGPPAAFTQLQRAVNFPVYYPTRPPAGLSLDSASFSNTSRVALYSYTYDGDKRIHFSIQPRTPALDPAQFRPTSEVTTHIGRAYIVDLEDRITAAVVGEKSWLLINAPDKIPLDTFRELIDSLRP